MRFGLGLDWEGWASGASSGDVGESMGDATV